MGWLMSHAASAQKDNVGIGTLEPDRSAVLDIQSSNKGLLIPRMSVVQRNAIPQPANGLMVYQTDALSGFYFYDGREWKPLGQNIPEAKATANVDGWLLNGNPNATANSFIGVPSGVPLQFRIGNSRIAQLSTTNIFIGAASGGAITTGISNFGLGSNAMRITSTGSHNFALGSLALNSNISGSINVAIGNGSMLNNVSGNQNVAIGNNALSSVVSAGNNVSIGLNSAYKNLSSNNTVVGTSALYHNENGNSNVALGFSSGFFKEGSGNIFLGTNAGRASVITAESNKLYIANTSTTTPLIYGDFSAKFISIGDVPVAKRDAIASAGQYGLLVKGGIMTEKIKVALASTADWADYVFTPEYQAKMLPLEQVEAFILKNKHLPNVPSAAQMAEEGLDVTQTSAKLLEKIEELTLYMIEMKKEIKALQQENEALKKKE